MNAKQWIEWHEANPGVSDEELNRRIQADALRDAAAMNCVNHVPACNCDVCAFTKRILTAARTLDASAAQPNAPHERTPDK